MRTTILAMLPLLLALGCGVVRGNGVPATTERAVGSFDQVRSELSVPVEILAGAPAGSVQVTCDENLQDEIFERVVGDRLVLSHREGFSVDPQSACRITVPAPLLRAAELHGSGDLDIEGESDVLERLSLEGSGDLRSTARLSGDAVELDLLGSGHLNVDHADATSLEVRLEGSGDLALRDGSSQSAFVDLEGSGDLDLADASCEAVEVTLEGSGDVRVRATRTVTVRLRGSGNVTVLGSPDARDEQVTGSGQVTYP